MKRKQHAQGQACACPVLTPSITLKLTLFMVGLIGLLLALVWVLNVQLLEFFYNNRILSDLNRTADAFAELVDTAGKVEGVKPGSDYSEDFLEHFYEKDYEALLVGKCIEVANPQGQWVFGGHFLASNACLIHPVEQSMFGGEKISWDNKNSAALRVRTQQLGDDHFTIENGSERQKVVCRRTQSGYTVIVSTDLERIGQAGQVIGLQMPVIAAVLLLFAVAGAYWFSRWFTRPVMQLSHAAREMARGNYNVRVTPCGNDEIGMLAQDFNAMAGEVARANELQRDLIANVSHDLRTPLTLIKGYAETMRDINGDDPEKRNEQLEIIVDETDRLSALVNSVMDLSKYSSGTIKPNKVLFDLAQMCDEVGCRYENICEQSGCHLHIEADKECMVYADPDSLQRVIHNLLANALHHVGEDGFLALRAIPQESGAVRVEVEDHGAGIPKEDLPYIFDKYYRSRADAGKVGTGLGLSITKAILVSHGFGFGVASEPGKGSTFWFETLPVRPAAKPAPKKPERIGKMPKKEPEKEPENPTQTP